MQFYRSLRTQRFADRLTELQAHAKRFKSVRSNDEVSTSRSIRQLNYAKQTQFPAAKLE
jgi:hypothetical protein